MIIDDRASKNNQKKVERKNRLLINFSLNSCRSIMPIKLHNQSGQHYPPPNVFLKKEMKMETIQSHIGLDNLFTLRA